MDYRVVHKKTGHMGRKMKMYIGGKADVYWGTTDGKSVVTVENMNDFEHLPPIPFEGEVVDG